MAVACLQALASVGTTFEQRSGLLGVEQLNVIAFRAPAHVRGMTVFVATVPVTAFLLSQVARLPRVVDLSCPRGIGAGNVSLPVSEGMIDFAAFS